MPDHFHLLLTPTDTLERTVQLIKGGFSHHAKQELSSNLEVWQKGFSDHRIRDAHDYDLHLAYIHGNPVRRRLCDERADYPYSSACPGYELHPAPQRLNSNTESAPDYILPTEN